jgi:4-aminobutyrate aminotransferase
MPILNLPGPKARAMIKRDQHVISPSYPRGYPFVMDHGKGSEVWDVDGNRFLDFMAGIAVASTGHSHPEVVRAIQEQAEKFVHISSDFYHEKWIELAEKLDEIAPFKESAISFMSNSGAEAVESALKMARQYTRKTDFIGFLGGFHGRTMGAVTFTASKSNYHRNFHPLMSGVTHVPYPDAYRPLLESRPGEDYGVTVVRYIEEQILGRLVHPDNLAGILVEPIQGEGGYIVPTPGFFPALRQLCDKYNILLIADEVQSGMGRTGEWWAIENFGVEPDIVCSAKGIASGMPLGVTFAKQHIVNWPRGSHGNTYGGNPISCAAALATIDLIEREYLQNAKDMGAYFLSVLEQMQARHPSIGQVRGKGLMIGVEFVKDRITKEPDEKVRDWAVDHAFYRGLLLLGCAKSVIRFATPLCVTKAEIDEAMDIFDESLSLAEDGVEPKETSEGEAVAA